MRKYCNSLSVAKLNIAFCLFIIIWGAWVRLSGSGAGCGEHWPLCNGEVIPQGAEIKTLIEFTHRLTSGLFGFTILFALWLAFKEAPKGHHLRKFAFLSLVLTLIEALIGAVLVKKGLVTDNSSSERAYVIAFHLINTFLLLGSLVGCYYFAKFKQTKMELITSKERLNFWFILVLFLLVGAMGAVTALGNTLFPEQSLVEGIYKDFDVNSHFLIRLRIYHPLGAALLVGFLARFSLGQLPEQVQTMGRNLLILSVVSLGFGVLNWLLMAPVWGALIHLTLADLLWLTFCYIGLGKKFIPYSDK